MPGPTVTVRMKESAIALAGARPAACARLCARGRALHFRDRPQQHVHVALQVGHVLRIGGALRRILRLRSFPAQSGDGVQQRRQIGVCSRAAAFVKCWVSGGSAIVRRPAHVRHQAGQAFELNAQRFAGFGFAPCGGGARLEASAQILNEGVDAVACASRLRMRRRPARLQFVEHLIGKVLLRAQAQTVIESAAIAIVAKTRVL